jgi:hypothetical protein
MKKWGSSIEVLDKIIDSEIKEHEHAADIVIIGTIFKDMPERSTVSILCDVVTDISFYL